MNLDYNFVQVSKLNEDKKRSLPEMEHFFPRIKVKTQKKRSPKMEHFFPQIQVDT